MSKTLTFSVIIVAFILGISTGFVFLQSSHKMADKKNSYGRARRADRFVDLRYIDGVIAHHLNAIIWPAKPDKFPEKIRDLAKKSSFRTKKYCRTLSVEKNWFNNTKQITNYEKNNLGAP
jgi:hypothetical protein